MTFWDFWLRHPWFATFIMLMVFASWMSAVDAVRSVASAIRSRKGGE